MKQTFKLNPWWFFVTLILTNGTQIIDGVYDLATGKVEFISDSFIKEVTK